MKKAFCLFLAIILSLSALAVSFADEPDGIPGTVEIPYAGFRFVPPELFRNTTGIVVMDGVAEILDGVYYAYWTYYAMTEEERDAWLNDHNPDAPAEYRVCPLFFVLVIGNGMTFRSFNALNGNAIPTEYVREIGAVGDYTFCLYMEGPNQDFIDVIDPVYRDEYTALASAADDVATAFTIFEPTEKLDPYAGLIGSKFEFTTTDLDGNPIASADLFAQSEITVVNIWTSWCGPCIRELPELQELYTRLLEEGCSIVGMLADDDLDTAQQLIADNGVTYPILLAPDTLNEFIRLEAVPTTLFIGRDGTVLAAPVVGAYIEKYEAVTDSLLQR